MKCGRPPFIVRELRYDERRLRGRALDLRTRLSRSATVDPHDEHARHFVALDGDVMVGSARLCFHDHIADVPDAALFEATRLTGRVAFFDQLVVEPARRGQGIARYLDTVRLLSVDREGRINALVRVGETAGAQRARSLERRGFVAITDGFVATPDGRRCLPMHRRPK